jgi:hypothetical protein
MTISERIARKLGRLFPATATAVRVRMLHGRAVRDFVRRVEAAHRATAGSRQVFKR